MKKILSIALILGATALMACPMQGGGMMGGNGSCQGMMGKCECDTKKLPPMFEKLDLNDKQKEQIAALRAEAKKFHNAQHEKVMAVLTPEQRGKLEGMRMMMKDGQGPMCPQKGDIPMQDNGMGCKNCDDKK